MAYQTQTPGGASDVLETQGSSARGLLDPLRGFRFTADFYGLGTSSFKRVSGGFDIQVQDQEYREGGFASLTSRKVPGLVTYNDMTLEKGMYNNPQLYDWFCSFLCGETVDPVQTATITVYDNQGVPTARWELYNAWPKEYRSEDLDAENSSILVESLTIAHEGIQRVTV